MKAKPAAAITFGAFVKEHLASIEDDFKNPKRRQQGRKVLEEYDREAARAFE